MSECINSNLQERERCYLPCGAGKLALLQRAEVWRRDLAWISVEDAGGDVSLDRDTEEDFLRPSPLPLSPLASPQSIYPVIRVFKLLLLLFPVL